MVFLLHICVVFLTIIKDIKYGDLTMLTQEQAEQIAEIFREAVDEFNGEQISVSYDIAIRRYGDRISEIGDYHVFLERYLSDSDFERGKYKMSLRFDYKEDRVLVLGLLSDLYGTETKEEETDNTTS